MKPRLKPHLMISLLLFFFGFFFCVRSDLTYIPYMGIVLMLFAGVVTSRASPSTYWLHLLLISLAGLFSAYLLSVPLIGGLIAFFSSLALPSLRSRSLNKAEAKPEAEEKRAPTIPFERRKPGMLIVCSSPKEAEETAVNSGIALIKAMYKVVLVDRSGSAASELEDLGVPFRIVRPDEVELLYPGELKEAFPSILASLLSPLTGVTPSTLVASARSGKWGSLIREKTTPEILKEALRGIAGVETFLLVDLYPKAGPLLIDLSELRSEISKEIATILLLLQALVLKYQDFVVVASLFRPIQRELMRGTGKDAILQLLDSLESRGVVISTTFEVDPAAAGCFSQFVLSHPINLPSNRALADMFRSIDLPIPKMVNELGEGEGLFIGGRPVRTRKFKLSEVAG